MNEKPVETPLAAYPAYSRQQCDSVNLDWKSGRSRAPHSQQQHRAHTMHEATVAIAYFGESEANTIFLNGIEEGFKQAGYIEGQNLTLLKGHGSAEISMLPQVTQSLVARNPDALIAASTPNLAAAIQVSAPPPCFHSYLCLTSS